MLVKPIEYIVSFLQWLHITPHEVVASCLMYCIVRGFYKGLKMADDEVSRIIRTHKKDGHNSRLKECREGECVLVRRSDRLDSAQVRPVIELPVEL